MSIKAETLDKNSERYTESTEFKKISSAILKTYGQDEGLAIIIHLIHEIEKPAEKQIEYVPSVPTYPTYPYYDPYSTGTKPLWDWTKVTCDGNAVEMPKVPTLNGPYVYSGPVPDIKLGTDIKLAPEYTTASTASSSAKDAKTTITNATNK